MSAASSQPDRAGEVDNSNSSSSVEQREEGEELSSDAQSGSLEQQQLGLSSSPPQSPSSSQQKRRRYEDETQSSRRQRSERSDELSDRDRREQSEQMEPDEQQHGDGAVAGAGSSGQQPHHAAPASASASSSSDESKAEQTELRLLVDSNHVGAIIGKGGEVIKRLREDNSCYINILKAGSDAVQPGGNRERVMVLKAQHDAVLRTLSHIIDLQIESAHNRDRREHGDDAQLKDATQVKLLVHRSAMAGHGAGGGPGLLSLSAADSHSLPVLSSASGRRWVR